MYRVHKVFKVIVAFQDLMAAKEKLVQLAKWLVILKYQSISNCLWYSQLSMAILMHVSGCTNQYKSQLVQN